MKPILFNTEMVRAILDEKKTCTRRVVKPQPPPTSYVQCTDGKFSWAFWQDGDSYWIKSLFDPSDIIYVRETWCSAYDGERYFYLADKHTYREEKQLLDYDDVKWRPSIHMPKEAARIFLRVTDVRVERLQEITCEQAYKEGCTNPIRFDELWNSTIKPADLPLYGWEANPWVWVIEFERCEKPEEIEYD